MSRKDERYRFAFDLGATSIGWAVYELDAGLAPVHLRDAGVRIFSDSRDPKTGNSMAEERRGPRSMRRNRDRYLQRRAFLMDELIKAGLMPALEVERKALEMLDPYDLRRKAIHQSLSIHEFGRALFHINQRRGFQSNRIASASDADEGGKIKQGQANLRALLSESDCQTYGEFLARRHDLGESVRIRPQGKDAKTYYEFYPTRDILKAEFNALWASQAKHHSELTPERHDHFFEILFFQRPLKPYAIGKCAYFPTDDLLARSHPLSEARRIYQDLNRLKLILEGRPPIALNMDDRNRLALVLFSGEDVIFKTGPRKHLGLPAGTAFTFEDDGKIQRLLGDQVAANLANRKKGPLQHVWRHLSIEQRADIAWRLSTVQDEEALIAYLTAAYGLDEQTSRAVTGIELPRGHDTLGMTATVQVLEALKADIVTLPRAMQLAFPGKHQANERDEKILERLPYYGEVLQRHTSGGTRNPSDKPEIAYGRLSNPTAHVMLNQLRRVVNALVNEYGRPEHIMFELARDLKLSQKQKDELAKRRKYGERESARRKAEIEALDQVATPKTMTMMRLWEEMGPPEQRRCVYTGQLISLDQLLSGGVEIERILPYSRTLDDTFANHTLAILDANRGKRNLQPAEAFSGSEYDAIRERARSLPSNKRWRFESNAIERFVQGHDDAVERQLNETRQLAILTRKYLAGICNDPDSVLAVTGQLTPLLRARLDLNSIIDEARQSKRTDFRHHAIDACVVGIYDRRLLLAMSRAAANNERTDKVGQITRDVPEPISHYRDLVQTRIDAVIVSHKPEHGTGGALHNDTNYGIVTGADRADAELVIRKPIGSLTSNEIERIRDLNLRDQLRQVKFDASKAGTNLAQALSEFGNRNGIRRVRIFRRQQEFIRIKDRRTANVYRAVIPHENHHIDIIEGSDGIWRGFAATLFDANQHAQPPRWRNDYPDAKLIMRVHKGDMLMLRDDDGRIRVKRVVRLAPSNNILYLVAHNEGGELNKRHEDQSDPFRWDFATISKLKERHCIYYRSTELGRK